MRTNNTTFRGKIVYGPGSEDMHHLVTKKVRDRMRVAPKGAELHLEDGYSDHIGKIGFSTPASGTNFISGAYGLKTHITEQHLLDTIAIGVKNMKKGITTGWGQPE